MNGLIQQYQQMGYTNVQEVHTSQGTGYYMLNKAGSGAVYLPPDAAQATSVVGMYPGMGMNWQNPQSGTGNYSDYIRGTVLSGNAPSGTILVFADKYGGTTPATVPDVVNAALNSGVNITNTGVMTFSGSGQSGMLAAGIVASEHSNMDVRVINCDAYTHTYIQQLIVHNQGKTDSSSALGQRQHNGITAMENGKVTVVNYIPDAHVQYEKYDEMVNDINYMANNGVNTLLVTGKSQTHGDYRVTILNSNGIEWLAGRGDIGTSNFVKVQKYDPSSKQWVDVDLNSGEFSLNVVDLGSNIVDPNNYRDLTYKLDTSAGVGNDSKLASDLNVVMAGMNELSGVIKGSNFDKAVNSCSSTVPVIGLMYDAQNYFRGVNSTLADNIGKESAVIANIAQAIYNMDVQLSKNTSGINDPVNAQSVNDSLSKILSTDITIPYASFASPVSFEKTTQGKAGKLCMSDIKAMLSGGKLTGPLAKGFETDISDTRKTIDSIKSFKDTIAANTSLQGDIWKEVNAKLDGYTDLLNKRISSNEKLQAAYEEALKSLEEYMEDYDELDDSKIQELKDQVTKLKNEITELQSKIDAMKTVCSTDKEGNESCTQVHVYGEAERAQFSEQIKQNEALIEELNAEIKKLEGLWEAINKAADIINGAVDEVKADYAKGVEGVAVAAPEAVLASTDKTLGTTDQNTQNTQSTQATQPTVDTSGTQSAGSWSGGSYYPSSSGGTPAKTEEPKSPKTDTVTNNITVIQPSSNTTQTQQPQSNEPTVINNYYDNNSGGGSYSRPVQTKVEAPVQTKQEEVVTTEPVIEEVAVKVEEEPVVAAAVPTIEQTIPEEEPGIVTLQPVTVDPTNTDQSSNTILKAGGLIAGVGLVAGAVATATNEKNKSKEESDDAYEGENDYTYDSNDNY